MSFERPNSKEAERAVLGSIMVADPAVRLPQIMRACRDIPENGFFDPICLTLYTHLVEMYHNKKPIDLLLVGEDLKQSGVLNAVGGYSFLEELIDNTPTDAHAEYYIEILIEKSKLRGIIDTAIAGAEEASSESKDSSEIISDVTCSMVGMIQVKEPTVTTDSIIDSIEEARNGGSNCIPTPWEAINRKTGGPTRGMETILTGRSKAGKSMLKGYWHKFLGNRGIPALDCPFEDRVMIAKMRAASVGRFSSSDLLRGGKYIPSGNGYDWVPTTDKDVEVARQSLAEMDELPMYWFDERCAPRDLKSKLAEYVDRYGIQIAFIDGVKDLLRPSGKYNDTGFDEEASATIVEAASDLDIALVTIHHLTKLEDGALIKSPNVRGSGNIVSNARLVYALQGDKHGAGLDKYFDSDQNPLSMDEEGYCNTRVFECIDNNHGGLAKTWLDCDLAKCDFWQTGLYKKKEHTETACLI